MRVLSSAMAANSRCFRQRGFNLLELIVTVAIVGILAGIGFPSFQELLASQRVRAGSSALYDSMIIARSEALKRNSSASFVIAASGWSVQVDGENVHVQEALSGLSFDPATATVQYGPTGRLTSGANTAITVAGTGTSVERCIRLDTTGRPRTTAGACS